MKIVSFSSQNWEQGREIILVEAKEQEEWQEGGVGVGVGADASMPIAQQRPATSSMPPPIPRTCHYCGSRCISGNALFQIHLPECKRKNTSVVKALAHLVEEVISVNESLIINFTALSHTNNPMSFHFWHFSTTRVSFSNGGLITAIYLDSDCTMSLIDRMFLKEILPINKISPSPRPIRVRGIGTTVQMSEYYTIVDFYIPES